MVREAYRPKSRYYYDEDGNNDYLPDVKTPTPLADGYFGEAKDLAQRLLVPGEEIQITDRKRGMILRFTPNPIAKKNDHLMMAVSVIEGSHFAAGVLKAIEAGRVYKVQGSDINFSAVRADSGKYSLYFDAPSYLQISEPKPLQTQNFY